MESSGLCPVFRLVELALFTEMVVQPDRHAMAADTAITLFISTLSSSHIAGILDAYFTRIVMQKFSPIVTPPAGARPAPSTKSDHRVRQLAAPSRAGPACGRAQADQLALPGPIALHGQRQCAVRPGRCWRRAKWRPGRSRQILRWLRRARLSLAAAAR